MRAARNIMKENKECPVYLDTYGLAYLQSDAV